MSSFIQSIVKTLPLQTLLGWAFPQIGAALTAVQASRTPDTELALVEAVLNAAVDQFAPQYAPKLHAVEATLTPLMDSGIAFEQNPSLDTAKPLAASLLVTAQVFVPDLPAEEAAAWLDATANLISKSKQAIQKGA